jgi:putative addiction module killer protein
MYLNGYNMIEMNQILRSDEFDNWLSGLKDKIAKARIVQRIDSAAAGNFGDSAAVGEGVHEMRVHVGPGYRIYYTRRTLAVYLLLVGGDKSSQKRDIRRAIDMARALK